MGKRGKQPKIYQETEVHFLLFKTIDESIPHDSSPTAYFSYQWVHKVHLESYCYGTSSSKREKKIQNTENIPYVNPELENAKNQWKMGVSAELGLVMRPSKMFPPPKTSHFSLCLTQYWPLEAQFYHSFGECVRLGEATSAL